MPFCEICWISYKADEIHLTSEVHTRPLKKNCAQCGQRFTSKGAKQRHFKKSSCSPPPGSGHRCWDCDQVFRKARKLFKHKKKKCRGRPQGPRPGSDTFCGVCNRSFKTAAGLKSHGSDVHKIPTGKLEYTSPTEWNEKTPAEDSDSSTDGDSSDTDSEYTPAEGTITPRPSHSGGNSGAAVFFAPTTGTITSSYGTSSPGQDNSISTPTGGFVSYGESSDFLCTPSESTINCNYGTNRENSVDPVYVPSYQGLPMGFSPALADAQNRAVPHLYLNNPAATTKYNLGIQGSYLQTPYGYLGGNVISHYSASAMYNNLAAFQGPVDGYYTASAMQNNLTPFQGPVGSCYGASATHNPPQHQNFASQPIANTVQAPAPHSKNKYVGRTCPLCPGNKSFKTEKSLQMHMKSEVHAPTIYRVPRPGENKRDKGKGKKQQTIPSFFGPTDRYYVKPIANSASNTVGSLNEGLSGMNLTDGPGSDSCM
ncbi:PR domain zinc finger protein 5 [Maublancomyces gigas]|uniref:PR domain zinc finger protein 5 n=1 Tax=Discina gigas TaxID=1032678 RepID=A0ABR3GVM6_9PEZI